MGLSRGVDLAELNSTSVPQGATLKFWLSLLAAAIVPFLVFELPNSLTPWGAGVAIGEGVIVLAVASVVYAFLRWSKPLAQARRPAIVVALMLSCFSGYGGYYLRQADKQSAAPVAAAPSPPVDGAEEMKVVASRQDSEGATQADLSPQFLSNLESYIVERTNVLGAQAAKDQGGDARAAVVTSKGALYVEEGDKKLAVIRLETADGTPQVVVAGIVGTELVRVTCVRDRPGRIPLSYGPCHDKLREAFGVALSAG